MRAQYKVFKYLICLGDYDSISMPAGSRLLYVGAQGGQPYVWALVNPEQPMVRRKIRIAGTGHPIDPTEAVKYVGTIQHAVNYVGSAPVEFVWHIFDLGETQCP